MSADLDWAIQWGDEQERVTTEDAARTIHRLYPTSARVLARTITYGPWFDIDRAQEARRALEQREPVEHDGVCANGDASGEFCPTCRTIREQDVADAEDGL